MDQGWDPYTYMWYYWWYYTSCYWAGYDMTGYEYPPGWDPNYPYCPPEFCSDYSASSDYQMEAQDSTASSAETVKAEHEQESNLERHSSSSPDLEKSRHSENGVGEENYYSHDNYIENNGNNRKRMMSVVEKNSRVAASSLSSSVPDIVIEDGDNVVGAREGTLDRDKDNNRFSVDSIKDCNNSTKNNTNHNGSATGKPPPHMNPLTECNQKPGNPTSLSCKRNDCDSVVFAGEKWKMEQKENISAEYKQQQKQLNSRSANDNDFDETSTASSSEDEYESCCEDPEQKVIERETGPCNNKPFLSNSSNSQNFHTQFSESGGGGGEHHQRAQKKFELHGNYDSELNSTDEHDKSMNIKVDEGDKTDPETDEDNDDDYGGRLTIIEEPETPSSADDSDVTPLVSGQDQQRAGKSSFYCNGGLSIEEYHSENSSSESTLLDYGPKKNRLSTIDEITESRASSSLFSNRSSATGTPTVKNLSAEFEYCNANKNGSGGNLISEESCSRNLNDTVAFGVPTPGDDDESEDSSDEMSSVSVIENKSDATRGTTESKREDETTSTSEEDSSTDDDDEDDNNNNIDEEEDDDDDEAEGIDTAVTVRLPLKLCFTKTKSYKDITTVMVGDSEYEHEESSQTSSGEINEPVRNAAAATTCNANDDHISESNYFPVEETDDEPVVSFTLSLSRQTSREDETKKNEGRSENEGTEQNEKKDEAPDIDFWAEITKGEEKEEESTLTGTTTKTDKVKCNQEPAEDYETEKNNSEADMGFWGIICRDRSVSDFPRRNRKHIERTDKNGNQNGSSQQDQRKIKTLNEDKDEWDPSESIDYKWEKDFNFWEKSSRTIETRRFSGNFEITEDYESDSGIKPSVERKERVKKYTHKRHSIPGPGWDRSSLPPRPTQKQNASNFSPSQNESSCNEAEIKTEEMTFYENNNNRSTEQEQRRENENCESLSVRKIVNSYHEESSSWWSYWDEVTKNEGAENSGASFSKQESDDENEDKDENSADVSVEIKLSESSHKSRKENNGSSGEDDYQSFASMQASHMKAKERKEDEVRDRKSLNHSCQSDATTVTTDVEDYSSSPEIKSSLLFPAAANQEAEKLIQQGSTYVSVSDENSDESSSRSSGTTIGRHDKTEIKKQIISSVPPSVKTTSPTPTASLPTTTTDVGCTDGESTHLKCSAADDDEKEEEKEISLNLPPVDKSIQIPVSFEKFAEAEHEVESERIKCNGKEQQQHSQEEHYHHHHHYHFGGTATSTINTTSSSTTSTTTTTTCTCLMSDRIARAENLLWRIERFLHESLSLGSEDDSGVMTDLSRQISDVDTDVDNDLNETEFLLTAAAAAKERRGMASSALANTSNKEAQHIESCNFGETISSTDVSMHHPDHGSLQQEHHTPNAEKAAAATAIPSVSSQVKKPRPKSDIFSESTLLSMVDMDDATSNAATVVEEKNGVKMRSASERRALRYQRAKTHSRLFQLLQDECGRDEDQDEFDYDSDVPTTYATSSNKMVTLDCQINVDASCSDIHHHHRSPTCDEMHDNSNTSDNAPSPTKINDNQARRSRLLPLPIKNLLASSLSLDSNSSPSGSSGVLSPTSPINRDQLLADIINEFHLRNQASTVRAQNQRRISTSFPSKVFKLLQHEFGEEFYQTFDCCGGAAGEESLISPSMSTNLCVNDSTSSSDGAPFVHECTIHKSESMKEFEEATNRILTNFMLRNTCTSKQNKAGSFQPLSESPSCTANLSSHSLLDDSKNSSNVDLLEVPLRKKKGTLKDPRSSKSTKKS